MNSPMRERAEALARELDAGLLVSEWAGYIEEALLDAYAAGQRDAVERCAQVADKKAAEHMELVRQFKAAAKQRAAQVHDGYAMVCSGPDGVADRIRALVIPGKPTGE